MSSIKRSAAYFAGALLLLASCAEHPVSRSVSLEEDFVNPPDEAKPWVFWYWMNAAVSRKGITADLEAMRQAGIGGAYLMPIQGPKNPPVVDPPVEQLSPEWWEMVRHAMREADRLGLKIAMHDCDGFALAGGPWITPELSMQKVVWTKKTVAGGQTFCDTLPQPESYKGYYRDIATYAFPAPEGAEFSTETVIPRVTSSLPNVNPQFLVEKGGREELRSSDSCWVTYEFEQPFTCRTITVGAEGSSYQAQRLMVEVGDDGVSFRPLARLQPPRHGWQNGDADVSHSIPAATARYFRFAFNKSGSEPGSEDLDAAKWKPNLKLRRLTLSGEASVNQHEGKAARVWRVSRRTTPEQVPDSVCIPSNKIINLTKRLKNGHLTWDVPAGRWTILRMGHTSTGHTNATGGAGAGLECDKLNKKAVRLQFDSWFGEIIRQAGAELSGRVLKGFHVDSWECGSQSWSPVLRKEFKKRRGYDMLPYLPAMTGLPVESADCSERFLLDLRQTIAELVVDNFYAVMQKNAHKHGCTFSAECVAPTMTGDGMAHYRNVDIPMGEFWLNSPTHDKPNDMLDATSGAHIYGKNIVQAEGFTQLRLQWSEHPAMLKSLGDRAYAGGINRLVYHVFAHNPFVDRQPGMTLSGIGLYFQRDQTWWKPGRAWVEYAQRCQALLQHGKPVTDIAVFTGEEIPARAALPERLATTLPGIVGREMVESEVQRLANADEPVREIPVGVFSSANAADPEKYVDMLRGYKYDSFNRDALLRLARVENGRIVLPGGASYAMLVLPQSNPLTPNSNLMSAEVATRLLSLIKAGATVLVGEAPKQSAGLADAAKNDGIVRRIAAQIWGESFAEDADDVLGKIYIKNLGLGRVVKLPYYADNFFQLGLERDAAISENGKYAAQVAWTHRASDSVDIYFISNQKSRQRTLTLALRTTGVPPELWDAVTGSIATGVACEQRGSHTTLQVTLPENGSVFVVFRKKAEAKAGANQLNTFSPSFAPKPLLSLDGAWQVSFDKKQVGENNVAIFPAPESWTRSSNPNIRHYSGTACYAQTFTWSVPSELPQQLWLDLGQVANIAEVTLNGRPCGVAWTAPYRVDITNALREGSNTLSIEVTNTWANRLTAEYALPENQRTTWTIVPAKQLDNLPLQEAGLLDEVKIVGGGESAYR
ncbi:MAG: DNA-binding protein [Prevotellaceae bacterium]|jgi:hypothetical protein|nr:DNA-binding protein [Prevotellaceae bacterium]